MLSAALAVIVVVPSTVAPLAGAVMLTVGAIVSEVAVAAVAIFEYALRLPAVSTAHTR